MVTSNTFLPTDLTWSAIRVAAGMNYLSYIPKIECLDDCFGGTNLKWTTPLIHQSRRNKFLV
jgi:hypothetical protein